jgi:lipopolysaccharide/colanic/teichoic acid biosynthesis glycosyltransferase
VLAAEAYGWRAQLIDRLAGVRPSHTNVLLLPGPFESLIGRTRFRSVQDIPLIEVVRETEWRNRVPVKRGLDLVGGLVLLAAAAVPMALVAAFVRLASPGPVLYRQRRIGLGGREFTLLKFRTMRDNAERDTGEVLAVPGDPRFTPGAALLRRLRLDELPQLFNVLRGDMSLVGPRPLTREDIERLGWQGEALRWSVRPGITGTAQLFGRGRGKRVNGWLDRRYIRARSLRLDLQLIALSFAVNLFGKRRVLLWWRAADEFSRSKASPRRTFR